MIDQISELSDLSRRLNNQSEKLNSIISAFDQELGALNLGVEVWLEDEPMETSKILHRRGEQDEDVTYQEGKVLGYCRIGSQWALALKTCWHDFVEDGSGIEPTTVADSETPLLKASRETRIKALELLPKLLDKMKTRADEMLGAIDQAQKIAAALIGKRAGGKNKLTLREVVGYRTGEGRISQYEVEGLPSGERAVIQNKGSAGQPLWKILRMQKGVSATWTGEFETPTHALAALQDQIW